MPSIRLAALAAFAVASALGAGVASAQVYRIVGPDGKVTFSDRPPPDAAAGKTQPVANGTGGGSSTATLPMELRTAVGRYPVVLYTAANCGPCDSARRYLQQRGVPYTENTVSTREDAAALQRLSGSGDLPFMTIGAQHVPGFSEAEWAQYLEAAGYPQTSQLPPGYRNPEPRPLVAVQQRPATPAPRPAAAPPQPQSADAAPPSQGPSPNNPAGIRF
jgi:glutaredoxin